MDKRVAAALAAVLGAAASGAWADVAASVRLTDLGYELIDLNPDDGIAPAISFDLLAHRAEIGVTAREWIPPEEPGGPGRHVLRDREWKRTQAFFPNTGRAVETPHVQSSAQISGSLAGHDLGAVVEGVVRNPQASPDLRGQFYAYTAPAWITGNPLGRAFSLTPFTQVVWTGHLALEAANTLRMHKGGFEHAFAMARLDLVGYGDGRYESFNALAETPKYRVGRDIQSHDLRLSYANDGAATAYAYFITELRAEGYSFQPVPEPGAAWLMLGGLGVLGAWHRRQRREARHAR